MAEHQSTTNRFHGKSGTPEHKIWKDIRRNKRGNTGTCPGWSNFIDFLTDVGERPTTAHKMARADKSLPYSCGKCQDCIARQRARNGHWMSHLEAAQNTARTTNITWNGETLSIGEWSRRTGVPRYLISQRNRSGWDPERIFTTPADNAGNQPDVSGRKNPAFVDRTGRRYGKLLVVRFDDDSNRWLCRCDCGTEKLLETKHLIDNGTQSCGCLVSTRNFNRDGCQIQEHALGRIWQGLMARCRDHVDYINRGVCEGFKSFDAFVDHMGSRPSERHSVERKNNDLGYFCGNCQECMANNWPNNVTWADHDEQVNNRSVSRLITWQGKTQTISQWADELGINRRTLHHRLNAGWSAVKAFTTDIRKQNSTNEEPTFTPTIPKQRFTDLSGKTFGHLTVDSYHGRFHTKRGTVLVWRCTCSCGNSVLVRSHNLTTGQQSCGCLKSFGSVRQAKGVSKHPLYKTWYGIVRRCRKHVKYRELGICKGLLDFTTFVSTLGEKPSREHSVDRIDNKGGYWCGDCIECRRVDKPLNIRWATKDQQVNNRGVTKLLTYKGQTKPLSVWARLLGVDRALISARLRHGWSIEDAFEKKVRQSRAR